MTIEIIKQHALDFMLRHGSHPQVIYVSGTKSDSVLLLDNLPEDHLQSRKYLFLKGVSLAQSQKLGAARELFLASEAWVSMEKPGQKKQIAPSKDPKKTEALVIYSLDIASKKQRLFMFAIERDDQGIARRITPFKGKQEMQAVSNPFLLTFLAGYVSVALADRDKTF